ncbi:MAG: shikimate kinase AroK [Gammaproteobacteria bacterium]|nr:shikimate kinase AroK [Gammaproteobacteria bacterium]
MPIPNNIFLVGPMGAGKSTVGRQLARALKKRFIDSDHVIEERTGADIPWIFDVEGEIGFRRREREIVAELTQLDGIVLATGGGVILSVKNRENLSRCGFVVYLSAPIELLVERTARDRNRPLLQIDDPAARMRSLMQHREPLYRRVADLVVKTDRRSARHVVKQIERELKRHAEPERRPGQA